MGLNFHVVMVTFVVIPLIVNRTTRCFKALAHSAFISGRLYALLSSGNNKDRALLWRPLFHM